MLNLSLFALSKLLNAALTSSDTDCDTNYYKQMRNFRHHKAQQASSIYYVQFHFSCFGDDWILTLSTVETRGNFGKALMHKSCSI